MSDNAETREALERSAASLRRAARYAREMRDLDTAVELETLARARENEAAALPPVAGPEVRPDETLRALETALDAADEAGEFGECCGDADCRACNVLVWIHDRIAAMAAPPPAPGDEGLRARVEALADELVERLGLLRALLSSDLEAAYQMRQPHERKQAISDMAGRVSGAWGLAVDLRELAAGRRTPPSFEDLLRDPTQQVDPEGVVLTSILDHQRRGLCLTPIPIAAPTTASRVLPPTGSTYVCVKPKPCPDHPALASPTPADTEAAAAGTDETGGDDR